MLTIIAMILGGIVLGGLAVAVGCVVRGERQEAEFARGERIAERLAQYDYPRGTFRGRPGPG
jgi:hypothetical protein